MDSNDAPHPQSLLALQKHELMLRLVYELLEEATEFSRGIFEQDSHPFDGWYYCHTARYHLYRLLAAAREAAGFPYQVFRAANTGIELYHLRDRIKVWKATGEGELPPPGLSSGRQSFIDQPQLPLFDNPNIGHAFVDTAKLVLLWDADSQHSLNEVHLVCPEGWETEWRPGLEHWRIAVPHPVNWIEATQDFSSEGGLSEAPGDLSAGSTD